MASAKKKETPEVSETAVAIRTSGGEMITHDYGDAAGLGWEETDQEDFQIPRIKQLQSSSPECEEGGDSQIAGAKAGLFLNTVTKELMTSFNFVVVKREHVVVEWIPQDKGGGFVGVHDRNSEVVAEAKANAVGRDLKTPTGNDLIDTFQLYLGILDEEGTEIVDFAIMALSSTKQGPYRRYMTRNRRVKGSKNIPLAAFPCTMRAVKAKNKAGKFYFNIEMNVLGGKRTEDSILAPGSEVVQGSLAFLESLKNGERVVKYDTPETEGSASTEEDPF